ncbi:MAG: ParB/RepB/Spo0J family partition protein [Alphaproteobacteria bacterium]|nr:ParB/RepB/Spo0J family partition protein [Alphaproteobacteria bacterium]
MSTKNRGLGRGLNALFEDEETFAGGGGETAPSSGNRLTLGIDQLAPGRLQPRKIFDHEPLEELASSIRTHGILQPIVVRATGGAPDTYEIIAGERRWRAAQRAQLHEVPVIVMELSDLQALEIALIENLQRADLNPVDEAMSYKKLLEEYGHTQEQLAEALGKSRSHIANMVRLLNLPDVVLAYVESGALSIGHARALITSKNAENLARQVVERGLNVRETEKLALESGDSVPKRPAQKSSGKDVNTAALEKDLSDLLGLRVSIDSRNGTSGKLVVEFKTPDQLEEFLKILRASSI